MTDAALIIFTRNPELGKCKTRLAASIGDKNALDVYKILIDHTVEITKDLPFDCHVYYSEAVAKNDAWDNAVYQKARQTGDHLGIRMRSAFETMFAAGYKKVAIIGSDLFDLTADDLINGIELLNTFEVVLGPAQDGGYYFLGLKEIIPQIFENKNWGTDSVYKDTLADLANKNVGQLPLRNDIDYFEDLKHIPEFKPFIPKTLL